MKTDFTAPAVLAACPGGDPGWAVGAALRGLFQLSEAGPVEAWQRLAIWTTTLVMKEAPGHAETAAKWVEKLRAAADNVWRLTVSQVLEDSEAPPTVVVTSGRYVSLYHAAFVFDLVTGTAVDGVIPRNWLETRVFNLRTLYLACSAEAAKWTPPQPSSGPIRTPRPSASSPSG